MQPWRYVNIGLSPRCELNRYLKYKEQILSAHDVNSIFCVPPVGTERRLKQQLEKQAHAQTQDVARVSAALQLGKEDATAAERLREELQRLQAASKSSQEKVPCYITCMNMISHCKPNCLS